MGVLFLSFPQRASHPPHGEAHGGQMHVLPLGVKLPCQNKYRKKASI